MMVTTSVLDDDQAAGLLDGLTALVARAGLAILAVERAALGVTGKADGSPVTAADLAADRVLVDGLRQLAPGIAIVSEERADGPPPGGAPFFLIDPLDGTKEFVAGRDEYTVNLALIRDGRPRLGLVGAPAAGLVWRGLVGRGAERLQLDAAGAVTGRTPVHTRPWPGLAGPGRPWIAAVSRSHGDARSEAFIDARPGAVRQTTGSAVKFARIAEGAADIYPRLSPTSEWDVAAGHALVEAAGGLVTAPDGGPLRYGEGPSRLVPGFIAFGDGAAATA
jgi:3'(2'), 5'-bisphosphate nucleotidase